MSDIGITFGTDGWRARGERFTLDRVRALGEAVAAYLDAENHAGPVVIGYDSRERSREAAHALSKVFTSWERNPTVAERDCPTPTLAWTVANGPFAGGLMVTASHNPPDYNGIKFITADGSPPLPAVTDSLEQYLTHPEPSPSPSPDIDERDLRTPYLDAILELTGADLDGLRVGYDAMYGSGRGVTDTALSRAGASVDRLRCTRDPTFGGVAPEPTAETAEALEQWVTAGEVDIGIINDGDADRVGVVTPERGYLDANVLLALLYEFLLETRTGDVVRTVPTSSLVDRIAAAAGQAVHETPVGFKWVAAAMTEHGALAGGEESGGYGLTEHLPNKDGVLVALLVCVAACERSLDARLDDLFATYGEIHQKQVSVDCPDETKATVVTTLATDPPATVAGSRVEQVSTVDGLKLTLEDGEWLLIRPSGTEPKVRLYAEAESPERLETLLETGRELL